MVEECLPTEYIITGRAFGSYLAQDVDAFTPAFRELRSE